MVNRDDPYKDRPILTDLEIRDVINALCEDWQAKYHPQTYHTLILSMFGSFYSQLVITGKASPNEVQRRMEQDFREIQAFWNDLISQAGSLKPGWGHRVYEIKEGNHAHQS